MLTDKCKEDFEKWISKQRFSIIHDVGERHMNVVPLSDMFEQLHASMQFGVYVDYFDSVGIYLEVNKDVITHDWHILIVNYNKSGTHKDYNVEHNGVCENNYIETRQEARKESIIKANQIRNGILN